MRGDVVCTVEVDRLDVAQVDEVADADGLRVARRDLVQFVGLDEDELAFGHLEALDDFLGRHFLAGAFVDPPVADPVGTAALQLVEVDRVVPDRGVQADRHAYPVPHQATFARAAWRCGRARYVRVASKVHTSSAAFGAAPAR